MITFTAPLISELLNVKLTFTLDYFLLVTSEGFEQTATRDLE